MNRQQMEWDCPLHVPSPRDLVIELAAAKRDRTPPQPGPLSDAVDAWESPDTSDERPF